MDLPCSDAFCPSSPLPRFGFAQRKPSSTLWEKGELGRPDAQNGRCNVRAYQNNRHL